MKQMLPLVRAWVKAEADMGLRIRDIYWGVSPADGQDSVQNSQSLWQPNMDL